LSAEPCACGRQNSYSIDGDNQAKSGNIIRLFRTVR
jgi:hypothetical protein